MACRNCGCTDETLSSGLCVECDDAESLVKLRAKVTEAKPYGVLGCQFGRAWDSWIDTFASLEAAAIHVRDRWQGDDFRDSDTGFHTDYSTYELIGFTLTDIGLGEAAADNSRREDEHKRKLGFLN